MTLACLRNLLKLIYPSTYLSIYLSILFCSTAGGRPLHHLSILFCLLLLSSIWRLGILWSHPSIQRQLCLLLRLVCSRCPLRYYVWICCFDVLLCGLPTSNVLFWYPECMMSLTFVLSRWSVFLTLLIIIRENSMYMYKSRNLTNFLVSIKMVNYCFHCTLENLGYKLFIYCDSSMIRKYFWWKKPPGMLAAKKTWMFGTPPPLFTSC